MKNALDTIKSWAWGFIDLMLIFIAVGVLVQVIFGDGAGWFSGVVGRLMALVSEFSAGGFVGLILASILQCLCSRRKFIPTSGNAFPLAGSLVGIVLGWQATMTILIFTALVLAIIYVIKQITKRRFAVSETIVFSVVAFLHHPFWRWFDGFW